jgi:hypothetical protein
MKIDDAVETIAKFFNDLIGALVPGMVLAAGLCTSHLGPETIMTLVKAMDSTPVFLMSLGVLFAVGHALSAMYEAGETFLTKWLPKQLAQLREKDPKFPVTILLRIWLPKGFDMAEAMTRRSYTKFLALVESASSSTLPGEWGYHDLRSVALSVSTEAASVGRRFMFISLLCNGVGAAMLLLVFDFAGCLLLAPRLLHPYQAAMNGTAQIVVMLLLAYVLFLRGKEFYRRAMTTPFSIALAEKSLKDS